MGRESTRLHREVAPRSQRRGRAPEELASLVRRRGQGAFEASGIGSYSALGNALTQAGDAKRGSTRPRLTAVGQSRLPPLWRGHHRSRQPGVVQLSGKDRAEAFLAWADAKADGKLAQYKVFEEGGSPGITSIWYGDCPSAGWGTGLTYGASLLGHPHLELMIVIESVDPAWAWALAHFVDRHRAEISELNIDDTINWHEPVSQQSAMDAFLIGPPVGAPDGEAVVQLGTDDHVRLLQAFPVHASELPLIRAVGGRDFLGRVGEDYFLDPSRAPVGGD